MRKISANYLCPIISEPIKNGIIVLNDDNVIVEIKENNQPVNESANVEFYNGVIVPGFVNTHCHLELSRDNPLKTNGFGLVNFLKEISRLKKNEYPYNLKQCVEVDADMFASGIQAVGDISNTAFTSGIKNKSKIKYHNFIELIGIFDNFVNEVFEKGKLIYDNFYNPKSITPHTSYSVSPKLFDLINKFSIQNNSIISIHNQETISENDLFENFSGEILEFMNNFENNYKEYLPTKKSSLKSYLQFFSKELKIILVHNTFTSEEDLEYAENYSKNIYWCTCPESNLMIENKLPDLDMFFKKNLRVTIGTDSLASNHKLNILEEMKIIQKKFPQIPFKEVLKWATLNGAKALNFDNDLGSLEFGKKPGIILIENFDFENFNLKNESCVKRIV